MSKEKSQNYISCKEPIQSEKRTKNHMEDQINRSNHLYIFIHKKITITESFLLDQNVPFIVTYFFQDPVLGILWKRLSFCSKLLQCNLGSLLSLLEALVASLVVTQYNQ